MKKNIFSGIRPSGKLTIGNYFSVISKFLDIEKKIKYKNYNYNCICCIADLHVLNDKNNHSLLHEKSINILSTLLSCGINTNSLIFNQSNIPEHSELNCILNNYVYFNELKNIYKFKNKLNYFNKGILKKCPNVGLFNYPLLMSSDILLYKSNKVIVGYDQYRHIEFCKKISKRFNKIYGNIFTIPEIYNDKKIIKIFSLSDPKSKMSKSDNNINGIIYLMDNKDEIKKKIIMSVTDSIYPYKINYDPINKPGISNLINIMSLLTNKTFNEIENEFNNKNYYYFKLKLIDIINDFLFEIQNKYNYFMKNKEYLHKLLLNNNLKAKFISKKFIKIIKKTIGLL